ncbi:MAG TPA: vitamin K epoxide reductase family protein, partial [Polyangia bacterium]|nr:vitamin K epoxide reductase family protein [Polyangia bacterium]
MTTTSEANGSGGRAGGERPSRAQRLLLGAILILALAGVATSMELTRIHYLTHTDPSFHSVCAVSETVNCETVAQSPYSVFLGLPISIWGMVAFLAFAVLAGWGLTRRRLHEGWPAGLLFAAAVVAAGVSGLMGWISYVRIDALCLFCMTLYCLSGLLLPVTGALLWVRRAGPLRALVADLGGIVRRPVLPLSLLVLAGAALGVPRALIQP